MNKPIIKKEMTTTVNGQEITVVGEVFEEPIKRAESHGDIFSQIRILNDRREPIHPGFSFPKQNSEEEIEYEVNFHISNINKNPKAYGL